MTEVDTLKVLLSCFSCCRTFFLVVIVDRKEARPVLSDGEDEGVSLSK